MSQLRLRDAPGRAKRALHYRTRRQRRDLGDAVARFIDFAIGYRWDPTRYPDVLVNRSPKVTGAHVGAPVPRIIWCFWTGDNPWSANRSRNIDLIERLNPSLEVRVVTPNNLGDFEVKGHPIHSAYACLSLNHRSDYLRCYFMHHVGGLYADIKQPLASWESVPEILESKTSKWAAGYRELRRDTVAQLPGRLGVDLRLHFRRLIGNGVFAFRPGSPLTSEWIAEVNARLDRYEPALSQSPGNMWGDNPGYPLGWAQLQAEVMQPLCLKYYERLHFDRRLRPSFTDYR